MLEQEIKATENLTQIGSNSSNNNNENDIDGKSFKHDNININYTSQDNGKKRKLLTHSQSTTLSISDLVRFADAIRLYIRHSIKRTKSFGQKSYNNLLMNNNINGNKFGIAKKDNGKISIPRFSTVGLQELRSHLQRNLSEKRFTMNEINDIINQLCEKVPEWISLSTHKINSNATTNNHKRKRNNDKPLTMVQICENVSYQSIREKLGIERRFARKIGGDNNSHNKQSIENNNKRYKKEMGDSSRSKMLPHKNDTNTQEMKKCIMTRTNDTILPQQVTNSTSTSSSSSNDDYNPSALLLAAGIEQTKNTSLRINPNQFLTDADRDGGEVIKSTSTNPRDLKWMFSKLNAGERI